MEPPHDLGHAGETAVGLTCDNLTDALTRFRDAVHDAKPRGVNPIDIATICALRGIQPQDVLWALDTADRINPKRGAA